LRIYKESESDDDEVNKEWCICSIILALIDIHIFYTLSKLL
jgi:hypothetical protein